MQAGGTGPLGGQAVFQVQDPQRRGEGVPLVEQLQDPGGEGQVAAGVTAAAYCVGPVGCGASPGLLALPSLLSSP